MSGQNITSGGVTTQVILADTIVPHLESMANCDNCTIGSLACDLIAVGYEKLVDRTFIENPEDVFQELVTLVDAWFPTSVTKLMIHIDQRLNVRIRSTAKEQDMTDAEINSLCLVYGYQLRTQSVTQVDKSFFDE